MSKTDRRTFLAKAGLLSLGALSAGTLLQSCGGSEDESQEKSSSPSPKPSANLEPEVETSIPDPCDIHNQSLSAADLEVRKSVGYKSKSEFAAKNCQNCRFYQADKFEGDCGGCILFAHGAVNSNGYCNSWAAVVE
jgi:hypothetical protein